MWWSVLHFGFIACSGSELLYSRCTGMTGKKTFEERGRQVGNSLATWDYKQEDRDPEDNRLRDKRDGRPYLLGVCHSGTVWPPLRWHRGPVLLQVLSRERESNHILFRLVKDYLKLSRLQQTSIFNQHLNQSADKTLLFPMQISLRGWFAVLPVPLIISNFGLVFL